MDEGAYYLYSDKSGAESEYNSIAKINALAQILIIMEKAGD
jgi:hypothetical protein